jgi:hypothetical protein
MVLLNNGHKRYKEGDYKSYTQDSTS